MRASVLLYSRSQTEVAVLAGSGLCTRTYALLTTQQAKQVDTWVAQYKSHANFKYIFRENARDVLNKQNPESVNRTLTYLASLC